MGRGLEGGVLKVRKEYELLSAGKVPFLTGQGTANYDRQHGTITSSEMRYTLRPDSPSPVLISVRIHLAPNGLGASEAESPSQPPVPPASKQATQASTDIRSIPLSVGFLGDWAESSASTARIPSELRKVDADVDEGLVRNYDDVPSRVAALAFSPTGQWLAMALADRSLTLFDNVSGQASAKVHSVSRTAVEFLKSSPDGELWVLSEQSELTQFELAATENWRIRSRCHWDQEPRTRSTSR